MVLSVIKNVLMVVPNKSIAINENVNKITNLSGNTEKTFTYITKGTGVTAIFEGAYKSSYDFAV